METVSYEGKTYSIKGGVTFRGEDFSFQEYELSGADGKVIWLENDEGRYTLWKQIPTMDIKTKEGKTFYFDYQTGIKFYDNSRGYDIEEGQTLLLNGKPARVLESEDVIVTSTTTSAYKQQEGMWYIDLEASGELYSIEIAEDGGIGCYSGLRINASQIPNLNSTLSKAFAGQAAGGFSTKGGNPLITGLIVFVILACAVISIFFESGDDYEPQYSLFCSQCASYCSTDSTQMINTANGTLDCLQCKNQCAPETNSHRYSRYTRRPSGSRSYGGSFGGK